MASEMPVLPDVGSSTVQPGCSRPSASAFSIIARAGRSLMEPVGLRSSSFAHSRTCGAGESDGRPTSGVSPTACNSESYRAMTPPGVGLTHTAGDGGQDRDGRVLPNRGLEAAGEPHVLVVDVDVHEAVQVAVLHQPRRDPAVAGLEVVDHLGDGAPLRLD